MTATELLLLINNENRYLYYDPIESCFTNQSANEKELERVLSIKKKEDILITDLVPNVILPTYYEIDHEEIMRFFVRECVEDKETRTVLFNILRRNEYVTPFINKIKELGLYKYYDDCCGSIYNQILEEWAEKHAINLYEK